MSGGSTGMAIALIATGVLGIGLAYSGRGPAVLNAIRGSGSGGDAIAGGTSGEIPPAKPNPKSQADCPAGTVWHPDSQECLLAQNTGGIQQYFVNAAGGVGTSSGGSTGAYI